MLQISFNRSLALSLLPLSLLAACGGNNGKGKPFPENFASLPDQQQVAFVMENASADSVARFICLAALGRVPEAKIDSLPMATLYAYENYKDSLLGAFSTEFDEFPSKLPLADKMKILAMVGQLDPQGLGYELGLDYVNQIREKQMTPTQVREEIKAFSQAADSMTYRRFLKGFEIVLANNADSSIPNEIIAEYGPGK